MVDAPAHDHVELALPRGEEVGAARVGHGRLERSVVEAVVRQGGYLCAAVMHLQLLRVGVEAGDQDLGAEGVVRRPPG